MKISLRVSQVFSVVGSRPVKTQTWWEIIPSG